MRTQRFWEAESQIEMQVAKWTVEGTVKGVKFRVFCDVRHTLIAGDMLVSCKSARSFVNQGGTTGMIYPPLTE